jgi:ribosome-associated protein
MPAPKKKTAAARGAKKTTAAGGASASRTASKKPAAKKAPVKKPTGKKTASAGGAAKASAAHGDRKRSGGARGKPGSRAGREAHSSDLAGAISRKLANVSPEPPTAEDRAFQEKIRRESVERRKFVDEVIAFFDEKKAEELLAIDLERVNPYFSIFVIATVGSSVQLKSIVREFMRRFSAAIPNGVTLRPEDYDSGWVVLDLIDVIVHVFLPEQRKYYNLERLWGDGELIVDKRKSTD